MGAAGSIGGAGGNKPGADWQTGREPWCQEHFNLDERRSEVKALGAELDKDAAGR